MNISCPLRLLQGQITSYPEQIITHNASLRLLQVQRVLFVVAELLLLRPPEGSRGARVSGRFEAGSVGPLLVLREAWLVLPKLLWLRAPSDPPGARISGCFEAEPGGVGFFYLMVFLRTVGVDT